MTNLDLKKLITGFLILAAIASSSALILANFSSQPKSPDKIVSLEGGDAGSSARNVPAIGQNAFVEGVPNKKIAVQYQPADTILNEQSDDLPPPPPLTDNLTQNLMNSLAREIIRANPTGPIDANGNLLLFPPENINLDYAVALNVASFNAKDFLKITPKDLLDSEIRIKNNYVPNDLIKYAEKVGGILALANSESQKIQITDNSPLLGAINSIDTTISQAIIKTKSLEVPEPLVATHKSLLGFLLAQQKIFGATSDYNNDPIKAMAVLKEGQSVIEENRKALESEIQKVDFPEKVSREYFFDKLSFEARGFFRIKVATAQLFVPIECAGPNCIKITAEITGILANQVTKTAYDAERRLHTILVQILRNFLVNQLGQQIVSWINGGGTPKFVTNWQSFLRKAGEDAANIAISEVAPQLCQSFAPLIRLQLGQTYLNPAPYPTCTLDQVVDNVQNFYNSFESGGWIAYSQMLLPSGNYYGSIFETSQIVGQAVAKAQQAEAADAMSNTGFPSPRKCVKYADPGEVYGPPQEGEPGVCLQYTYTTPGGAVKASLDKALGGTTENIVNAIDITGLVAAVVDSAINRLIRAGIGGIANVAAGGQSGPGSTANLCDGLTGQAYQDCVKQTSGFDSGLRSGQQPLSITTNLFPSATVGQNYPEQALVATGGLSPYIWTLDSGSMPPGIVYSPSGGIGGVPTTFDLFSFTMKVTDSAGNIATKQFTINVSPATTP
jgi:hypothetical protein